MQDVFTQHVVHPYGSWDPVPHECVKMHVPSASVHMLHASPPTMLKPCWETGGSGQAVDFQPCSKSLQPEKRKIWKSIRCWSQTSGNCTSWMSWISLLLKQKVLGLAPSWHWKNGFLDPSDPGLHGVCHHQGTLQNFMRISIPEYWEKKHFIKYSITELLMVQKSQKKHLKWKEACK